MPPSSANNSKSSTRRVSRAPARTGSKTTAKRSSSTRTSTVRKTRARATAATTKDRVAMSEDHKAALAAGRAEGRVVRTYLEALEHHRPRRGRKRTPDSISRRLSVVEAQIASADALSRLHLLKEKGDLEAELARARNGGDLASLERDFVKVARSYGQRKGITYSVWRAAGVGSGVLQRAGVIRGGRTR